MKEFFTAYGEKRKVKAVNNEPTMTKQAMKAETEINFIVDQYRKTGQIQHTREHEGNYGEFFELDYHEAMNYVMKTQQMFNTLPANIRNRFENDPAAFLEFVEDPANREEMQELGLVNTYPPTPAAKPDKANAGSSTPETGEPSGDSE